VVKLKVKYLTGTSKAIGLIAAKKAYPVFFQTRFGIHTFGLKFPIDVLILDSNNKVVKIAESLKPNHIFLWNPKFEKVIELPAGAVDKKKINVGSLLNLKIN